MSSSTQGLVGQTKSGVAKIFGVLRWWRRRRERPNKISPCSSSSLSASSSSSFSTPCACSTPQFPRSPPPSVYENHPQHDDLLGSRHLSVSRHDLELSSSSRDSAYASGDDADHRHQQQLRVVVFVDDEEAFDNAWNRTIESLIKLEVT